MGQSSVELLSRRCCVVLGKTWCLHSTEEKLLAIFAACSEQFFFVVCLSGEPKALVYSSTIVCQRKTDSMYVVRE